MTRPAPPPDGPPGLPDGPPPPPPSANPPPESRRPAPRPDGVRHVGRLRLDAVQCRAWRDDQDLQLTRTEFALLWSLAATPNQPCSRYQLSRQVWGGPDNGNTNLLAVCILRLRRKLEPDPPYPRYILTVRGSGYLLSDER